jgi:hypothetical protein
MILGYDKGIEKGVILGNILMRHVVYVPKSSTTFRGILICVIFRPRDMKEYYMSFGIFATDMGYISCLFAISPEPISNTQLFIYFVY